MRAARINLMLGFYQLVGLHLILPAVSLPQTGQVDQVSDARYPKREIAGVSVINTPIVQAAEAYARKHSDEWTFKHIMRCWLLGTLMIERNETLHTSVDMEIHAVASLLHDLGLDHDPNSALISQDRRFEVDGAIAARDFIIGHDAGKEWDERRVQLVWDSIALHGESSIANFKELAVQAVHKSIFMDFTGPDYNVTEAEFKRVTKAFPRYDLLSGFNETIIRLCSTKPSSTADTWMQAWGESYVANYSVQGYRNIDTYDDHP